jgi:hypothetical protein
MKRENTEDEKMMKINPVDLQEAHHHLTKAILFLDRNGVEDQVEALLKVKTTLPKPSEKKRRLKGKQQ